MRINEKWIEWTMKTINDVQKQFGDFKTQPEKIKEWIQNYSFETRQEEGSWILQGRWNGSTLKVSMPWPLTKESLVTIETQEKDQTTPQVKSISVNDVLQGVEKPSEIRDWILQCWKRSETERQSATPTAPSSPAPFPESSSSPVVDSTLETSDAAPTSSTPSSSDLPVPHNVPSSESTPAASVSTPSTRFKLIIDADQDVEFEGWQRACVRGAGLNIHYLWNVYETKGGRWVIHEQQRNAHGWVTRTHTTVHVYTSDEMKHYIRNLAPDIRHEMNRQLGWDVKARTLYID